MNNTVEINGRSFEVSGIEVGDDLAAKGHRVYGLTGKRSAKYAAVQFVSNRDLFYVINTNTWAASRPFEGVELAEDGQGGLVQVRAQGCPRFSVEIAIQRRAEKAAL